MLRLNSPERLCGECRNLAIEGKCFSLSSPFKSSLKRYIKEQLPAWMLAKVCLRHGCRLHTGCVHFYFSLKISLILGRRGNPKGGRR